MILLIKTVFFINKSKTLRDKRIKSKTLALFFYLFLLVHGS